MREVVLKDTKFPISGIFFPAAFSSFFSFVIKEKVL